MEDKLELGIVLYHVNTKKTVLIYDKLIIGRGEQADITIEDSLISSKHCQIFMDKSKAIYVMDLESKNATLVNDDPIPPLQKVRINDQDIIQIGTQLFLYIKDFDSQTIITDERFKRILSSKEELKIKKNEGLKNRSVKIQEKILELKASMKNIDVETEKLKQDLEIEKKEFLTNLEVIKTSYVARLNTTLEKHIQISDKWKVELKSNILENENKLKELEGKIKLKN